MRQPFTSKYVAAGILAGVNKFPKFQRIRRVAEKAGWAAGGSSCETTPGNLGESELRDSANRRRIYSPSVGTPEEL